MTTRTWSPLSSPARRTSGRAVAHRVVVGVVAAFGIASASGCPSEIAAPGCKGPSCKATEEENTEPPRIFVDPPFGLGFDCVTLGCDVERRMVVENRGGGTISVVLARTSVGTSQDFQLRTGTGAPLPVDADSAIAITADTPLELFVRYAPTDGVADSGSVVLEWHDQAVAFDDAVLEEVELPLSSRALGSAAASPDVRRLNFGFVPVGGYATRTVSIENTGQGGVLGTGPVSLEDSTPAVFLEPVAGAWSEQFSNPGDASTFAVNFRPDSAGTFTGALQVRTTDGAEPSLRIEVAGTAIADPKVVVDTPAIDFLAIRIASSRTLPITIRNNGGAPLTLQPSVLGADLALNTVDAVEVAPLESTTFQLTWVPTSGGALNGEVVFATNDPDLPQVNVAVTGFANAPSLSATPVQVNFGDVVQSWTTDAQSFELRNDGFGELTISTLAFEVGSSSQIRFAEVPNLPIKLSPDDPPVRVSVFMEASTLGTQSAVVLVGSDGVDNALGQNGTARLTASGVVVTCEQGCPVNNGEPSCGTGECRIGTCDNRFHDADLSFSNGCECGEDLVPAGAGTRRDVPPVCGGQNLGGLGDRCSSRPNEARFTGTIHGRTDVDLFFFTASDESSFPTCDVTSDSFRASVRIEGAPAGLRVCARGAGPGTGCGGENQRTCGGTSVLVRDGSFGSDDSRDVTVWVEWTPGQEQDICANYTLVARARE